MYYDDTAARRVKKEKKNKTNKKGIKLKNEQFKLVADVGLLLGKFWWEWDLSIIIHIFILYCVCNVPSYGYYLYEINI